MYGWGCVGMYGKGFGERLLHSQPQVVHYIYIYIHTYIATYKYMYVMKTIAATSFFSLFVPSFLFFTCARNLLVGDGRQIQPVIDGWGWVVM